MKIKCVIYSLKKFRSDSELFFEKNKKISNLVLTLLNNSNIMILAMEIMIAKGSDIVITNRQKEILKVIVEEYIKTAKGKVLCYKLRPVVPEKKRKDGLNDLDVWISADKRQIIMKAKAQLALGELILELK